MDYIPIYSSQSEYAPQIGLEVTPISNQNITSELFLAQKICLLRPRITFFRVFRAVFYSVAVISASVFFGVSLALLPTNTDIDMKDLGLFFCLILIIIGAIIFFWQRNRIHGLKGRQFILYILGATVAAFILLLLAFSLDLALMPHARNNSSGGLIVGGVLTVYSLFLALIALW